MILSVSAPMEDMQSNIRLKYFLSVLAAGTLWGFMGLFNRCLNAAGVNSAGVIFLRCGTAAVLFCVTILVTDPSQLKIRPRDAWYFVGSGLCSMLFFTYCYFTAMSYVSLSVAAILLYTAPFFVVLISAALFNESLTVGKIAALSLGFVGCCLVSGVGSNLTISVKGILFGLGAGIGYAMYSIFAKLALDRGYTSNTINFYTHSLAATGSALIWGIRAPLTIAVSSSSMLLFTFALGLFTCYLPYLLYTYSLTGLEAGKASIYANVEPVVATVLGILIYQEKLTVFNFLGIILVLSAVIILSLNRSHPDE